MKNLARIAMLLMTSALSMAAPPSVNDVKNALSISLPNIPITLEVANETSIAINNDQVDFKLSGADPKVYGGIRSELAINYPYLEGEVVNYQFDFKIPKDFAFDSLNRWWLIAQWHDQPNPKIGETWANFPGKSPPIAILIEKRSEKPLLVFRNELTGKTQQINLPLDEWITIRSTIAWSTKSTGVSTFEIANQGSKPVKISLYGANMNTPYFHYLKIGQYRNPNIKTANDVSFRNVSITRPSMFRQAANNVGGSSGAGKPIILLKLDDLMYAHKDRPIYTISANWQRVIDLIYHYKIKANIGILTESLDNETHQNYFNWIKKTKQDGLIEFWNHGHNINYKSPEGIANNAFSGTTLAEQIRLLTLSQNLAQSKLGFKFNSFGPHYSGTDNNTFQALQLFPEIKYVWFFQAETGESSSKRIVDRSIEMEYPTLNPDFEQFKTNFTSKSNHLQYVALQGHPQEWTDERFNNFKKIIEWLTNKGYSFGKLSETIAP
ncbi:heparin lyase I family protein [Chitinibacter tainanensis]|uniref:heparin lyase I family protein n=1 Tax=Chitinibacter tainanensis TaxID=230667 RepID=UPI000428F8A0|nr:heparin lyase I family protein [Chitinibacter tainanensis]